MHGGDPTRLPGALNHSQTGPPLAGLASSPAHGGVSSPGDQARSTAHGVFPIRSRHTLNHAHHSRDWCPSLHMKDSPVEGRVPSTPKKRVPTRGPRALNWAWRGSHPRAVCPQPRKKRSPFTGHAPSMAHRGVLTQGERALRNGDSSLLAGQVSSTAHAVVPTTGCAPLTSDRGVRTRGQRALKHTRRYPHSRAAGLNWAWRSPDTHYAHPGKPTDRSQLAARRPRLHTEGFPPTGHVPSTAHAVVPTTRLCAPKRSRSGSHPRAVRPRTHTEGFQLAGHTPSTAHGVVLTTRLCALNSHEGRPHSWATSSQLGTERFPLADPWAVCLHPCTQWSPPQRCVPSSAHAVVPTRRPWALNWARRASHPRTGAFNCTRSGPHLRAVRPQPHTEETPLSGHWPSTGHGGVPTHGT